MKRLQSEFQKALRELEGRLPPPASARILPLKRPQ
jgi:hypothetical protein